MERAAKRGASIFKMMDSRPVATGLVATRIEWQILVNSSAREDDDGIADSSLCPAHKSLRPRCNACSSHVRV
jgi:hypothetical protein